MLYKETPNPMLHTFSEVVLSEPRNKNNPLLKKYREMDNSVVTFCMDWLIPGKPLNAPQESPQAIDVFRLIRNSGGIPALAHPAVTLTEADDYIIDDLIKHGLIGLEVYTSWHNEENERHYEIYAQDKELVLTCGSDFHGALKPYAKLGEIKNNSYEVVEKLKKSNLTTNRHSSCK